MMLRHLAAAIVVVACATLCAPAFAQDPAAEARALFDQGRMLIESGDLGEACGKFRQSHQMDPKVGTLLNLAQCEEKRGFLAAALGVWGEAAGLAQEIGDERAGFAQERVAALDSKVPRLTLKLPADAPAGAVVRITAPNDEPRVVAPSDLGRALRVDAGATRIEVEAAGYTGTSRNVQLAAGVVKTFTLDVGEVAAETVYVGDDGGPFLIAGYIVGGVGLIGLGIGTALGLMAGDRNQESFEKSPGAEPDLCLLEDNPNGEAVRTNFCGRAGKDLRNEALSLATGSTIAFVAGGVALAAGVVMVLVAPSGENADGSDSAGPEVSLKIAPMGGSLQMTW
jgi:hypothetical protein